MLVNIRKILYYDKIIGIVWPDGNSELRLRMVLRCI